MPKHLTLSDQEVTYFFHHLNQTKTTVSKKQKQQQQKEQNQKPNDVNYASIMIFEGYFAKPLR